MTTTLEQGYSIHKFFRNCPLQRLHIPLSLLNHVVCEGGIQLVQIFDYTGYLASDFFSKDLSFCLRCWIYGWSQIEHWCHCMCSSWITNCHQAEHLHPWGRKRSKLSCSDFMQHHCKNKNLSILPACYFLHNGNFIMQGMSITVKKLSQKTRHEYKTWSTDLFA